MQPGDGTGLRFLAEWYVPREGKPTISELASSVRRVLAEMPTPMHPTELLYALEVPTDAYAFGVFTADSADAVSAVCEQVGHPADRVSEALAAVEDSIPTQADPHRATPPPPGGAHQH